MGRGSSSVHPSARMHGAEPCSPRTASRRLSRAAAFANQLLERALIQVAETFKAHTALADVRLGQRFFVLLSHVSGLTGRADIKRDVILVAGDADAEPVAFASALIFVMVRTVSQHPAVDEGLQFRCHFTDQRVQGGNFCLAGLCELRQVFRRGGSSELAFHDLIAYHTRPRLRNPPTAPPAFSSVTTTCTRYSPGLKMPPREIIPPPTRRVGSVSFFASMWLYLPV